MRYVLIGSRKQITAQLVDEVLLSCKDSRTGTSMLDFQKSSATARAAVPYYSNELLALNMPVVFIVGGRDPLIPLRDVRGA